MVAHRAARATALVLFTSAMLLVSASVEAASAMKCRQAVESAWKEAKVEKSDVVSTTAMGRTIGGGIMPESSVHARLKSCSGTLVVNLSKSCHVRDIYTTGDCRLPGVPAYP